MLVDIERYTLYVVIAFPPSYAGTDHRTLIYYVVCKTNSGWVGDSGTVAALIPSEAGERSPDPSAFSAYTLKRYTESITSPASIVNVFTTPVEGIISTKEPID